MVELQDHRVLLELHLKDINEVLSRSGPRVESSSVFLDKSMMQLFHGMANFQTCIERISDLAEASVAVR